MPPRSTHWAAVTPTAKQGNDYSMYQIGLFYERGLGVSKDLQQARYWYKQAEENGNVIAAEAIVRIDGQ